VELQPLDDAETVAQRRGQQAGAGGGADEGKGWQVDLDRTRGRALADHDVELEILHRRIQHLLDRRREAVDLVDEQHVVRLQVGQQRGQVAGLLDHRAGGDAQAHPQLVGDHVAEGGLAQARRAEDQDVVERLAAVFRGLDVQAHLLAHRLLAEVFGQPLGPDAGLDGVVLAGRAGADDALLFHRAMVAWRPGRRIAPRSPCPTVAVALRVTAGPAAGQLAVALAASRWRCTPWGTSAMFGSWWA